MTWEQPTRPDSVDRDVTERLLRDPSATLAAAVLYARVVVGALPVDDAAEREAERAWASQPQGKRRRLAVRPAR